MTQEGPLLESLLRRLAETPPDFLGDPAFGNTGSVHSIAVVNDVLIARGAAGLDARLGELAKTGTPHDANRLRLAQVLAWLLADPWFRQGRHDVLAAIVSASAELASLVPASKCVEHPERREELARLALSKLGLRPAGESEELAADRLTALSSAERARVLAASRAAEERARAIREALAKKAAEESADKWSRE